MTSQSNRGQSSRKLSKVTPSSRTVLDAVSGVATGDKGKRVASDEGGGSKRARFESDLEALDADESMADLCTDTDGGDSSVGWISASDDDLDALRSSSPERPLASSKKRVARADAVAKVAPAPKGRLGSPFNLVVERKIGQLTEEEQGARVESPPPIGSGTLDGPFPSSTAGRAPEDELQGLIHSFDALAVARTLLKQHRNDMVWMKGRLLNHHRNVIRVTHLAEKTMQAVSRAQYVQGKGEEFMLAQGAPPTQGGAAPHR